MGKSIQVGTLPKTKDFCYDELNGLRFRDSESYNNLYKLN